MHGRERLLTTLGGTRADRVPRAPFLYCNSVYEMFRHKPQIETFWDPPDFDIIEKSVEYCDYFGFDVLHTLGSVWDVGMNTSCDRSIVKPAENWDVTVTDDRQPDEMQAARKWSEARFDAKARSKLPFSFRYGGKPSNELLGAYKHEETVRKPDNQCTRRTIALTDPGTGLAVRCVVTAYHDCPALEWTLYFKNTGGADTPILTDIQALDTCFGQSVDGRESKLYYAEGSHEKGTDFQPLEKTLAAGDRVQLSSYGGRSSDGVLPLFNLAKPGGAGLAQDQAQRDDPRGRHRYLPKRLQHVPALVLAQQRTSRPQGHERNPLHHRVV